MSFRWFAVRFNGLSASARIWADENDGWSPETHALADVWDAVMATRAAVIAAATTKPGQRMKLDSPSYPRPKPKPAPQAKGSWAGSLARRIAKGGR